MDCDKCFKQFNNVERLEHELPCGHTICVQCMNEILSESFNYKKKLYGESIKCCYLCDESNAALSIWDNVDNVTHKTTKFKFTYF